MYFMCTRLHNEALIRNLINYLAFSGKSSYEAAKHRTCCCNYLWLKSQVGQRSTVNVFFNCIYARFICHAEVRKYAIAKWNIDIFLTDNMLDEVFKHSYHIIYQTKRLPHIIAQ
jgi:hypothetical protein